MKTNISIEMLKSHSFMRMQRLYSLGGLRSPPPVFGTENNKLLLVTNVTCESKTHGQCQIQSKA